MSHPNREPGNTGGSAGGFLFLFPILDDKGQEPLQDDEWRAVIAKQFTSLQEQSFSHLHRGGLQSWVVPVRPMDDICREIELMMGAHSAHGQIEKRVIYDAQVLICVHSTICWQSEPRQYQPGLVDMCVMSGGRCLQAGESKLWSFVYPAAWILVPDRSWTNTEEDVRRLVEYAFCGVLDDALGERMSVFEKRWFGATAAADGSLSRVFQTTKTNEECSQRKQ